MKNSNFFIGVLPFIFKDFANKGTKNCNFYLNVYFKDTFYSKFDSPFEFCNQFLKYFLHFFLREKT